MRRKGGRIPCAARGVASRAERDCRFLVALARRDRKLPHVYFGWSEGNPLSYLMKYIAFGEGDNRARDARSVAPSEKDPGGGRLCRGG